MAGLALYMSYLKPIQGRVKVEKMIEVVPTLIVPIFASLQKELTEKADRFNTHRTQTEPFKKLL